MTAPKHGATGARYGWPAEAPGYVRPKPVTLRRIPSPTPDDRIANLAHDLKRDGLFAILEGVAAEYFVTLEAVLGRGQSATVTRARKACYHALRRFGLSWPEIGALLDRDSSAVIQAAATYEPPPGTVGVSAVRDAGEMAGCEESATYAQRIRSSTQPNCVDDSDEKRKVNS